MCRPTNDSVSICLGLCFCCCRMLTRCSGKYRSNMRTAHMLEGGRSQLLLLLLLSLLLMPYANVTQIGSRHADYREWQNVTVPRFTCNFIRLRKPIKQQTKPNNLRCFRWQQWIEWNLMSCVYRRPWWYSLDVPMYIVASWCRRVSNAIATLSRANLTASAVSKVEKNKKKN